MKIYGYAKSDGIDEDVIPYPLAEISLEVTPAELRRIAAFLVAGANEMERMGKEYSHEHLSDKDPFFETSPDFVISPPAEHAA